MQPLGKVIPPRLIALIVEAISWPSGPGQHIKLCVRDIFSAANSAFSFGGVVVSPLPTMI